MYGDFIECLNCHATVEKPKHIPLKQIDFVKWAESLEEQIKKGEIDLPLHLVSTHIKRICRQRGYDFWYVQNINAKLPERFKNPAYKHVYADINDYWVWQNKK